MKKFDFENINLIPSKCIVNSRSEISTKLKLGNFEFNLPIIPANMECVIDDSTAEKLSSNGYFYIMHRFGNDPIEFIKRMKSLGLISSISIGVNRDSYDLISNLLNKKLIPDFITVDIAHGHAVKMEKMLKHLKEYMPSTFIIAGNVSTPEAVKDLENWGADAVKVGIGPGLSCTTWPSTGFGSRNCQASTIYECSKVAKTPIIADGGVRVPGDIAKSIVMGATMVMIGGMLSGFKDSPGNLINVNGSYKKEFWGSASQFQSGKSSRIEGTKVLVEYKDRSILDELKYLEECLQSSISYGGGNKIDDLYNVKWF